MRNGRRGGCSARGCAFCSVTEAIADSFTGLFRSIDYSRVYVTFVETFHLDNSSCPSTPRGLLTPRSAQQ